MTTKQICFRFDIDSHKCLEVGVPNLLKLAREKDVKFSFMVNCGRSINLWLSILAKFTQKTGVSAPHLSPRRKLGNIHFLRCALLNPRLASSYGSLIREIHLSGHEVGLHGGRNHETWARQIASWNDAKIRDEVAWGLEQLRALEIVPEIFTSPCAVSNERVQRVIAEFKNFHYVSDRLVPGEFEPKDSGAGLMDLPVALSGEGGIAFIEQQIALGRSSSQMRATLHQRLGEYPLQIVYDHPYLAGDEGLIMTADLVDVAKSEGFRFVGLREIGDAMVSYNKAARPVS